MTKYKISMTKFLLPVTQINQAEKWWWNLIGKYEIDSLQKFWEANSYMYKSCIKYI